MIGLSWFHAKVQKQCRTWGYNKSYTHIYLDFFGQLSVSFFHSEAPLGCLPGEQTMEPQDLRNNGWETHESLTHCSLKRLKLPEKKHDHDSNNIQQPYLTNSAAGKQTQLWKDPPCYCWENSLYISMVTVLFSWENSRNFDGHKLYFTNCESWPEGISHS